MGCDHRPEKTRRVEGNRDLNELLGIVEGEVAPDYTDWFVKGMCRYGNCQLLLCPECGAQNASFGPVGCKCEDEFLDLRGKILRRWDVLKARWRQRF